ncbi:cytochrome-c oxidase chain VIIc [Colletotrichum karsti]|uniref:Cytochrome c oxidase subunit 8, mitochondrial n=1 Tax=Colletotrichum karsti TaxID=1095194 RepID=A0A9P6HZG0_9PEZI|nr:cytochrome-c oxidase chain VIIc [Colletotrichum karsti]KAF9871221.1 cytochrome-c oxidase chain VIIc [Colletotrichum karsti]
MRVAIASETTVKVATASLELVTVQLMLIESPQMLARAAARAVPQTRTVVARRGFQTTRAQMSSPYHYPEGPYSNIPFNPKSKFFGVGFWTYSFVGFFAPFGIAAWQTYKPKV